METSSTFMVFFYIFYIILFAVQIFTIIHAWKHLPVSTFVKIICSLLILVCSWIAVMIYWIYFAIKRPNGRTITKPKVQCRSEAPQETNSDEEENIQLSDDINSKTDEEAMRTLFNEAMNGANGRALTECYEKLMNLFIMKENGECKGAGFSGLLDERDRAKRLEKMDNQVVLPALKENPAMYEAWWTTVYLDVLDRMQNSPNKKQINMLEQIHFDVERGDELLDVSGATEYMQNYQTDEKEVLRENVTLTSLKGRVINTSIILKSKNEGKNIKIMTLDDTVKIKRQEKHGKIYYEIKGAYKYFYLGLSDDELIRIAEILIAVPSIVQFNLKDGVNKVWMEEYDMPSLTKLGNK